jgi:RNA-directed DNA polymerase
LKRKHPYRNKKWLYKMYVKKVDNRSWRFGINRNELLFDLSTLTDIKLTRLKAGINPYYDLKYYRERPRLFVTENFRQQIYKKHKFKCVVCKQLLDNGEQIDLHHLKPRKDGGKYSLTNIVPVHQTCHIGITHARKQWFKGYYINSNWHSIDKIDK